MRSFLVKAIRIFLVGAMTVVSVVSPNKVQSKIKDYKEGCKASIAVVSDLHLKNNFIRQGVLELGLADMQQAEDRLDAVVFNGDITESSYDEMWECFTRAMLKYDIADQSLMVIGNHDTRNHEIIDENGEEQENPEGIKNTFIEYNKKATGRDIDNVYYTANIAGYPVIVLGSEGSGTAATVSQTQVDWFDEQMDKAAQTGLPIFVFFHQSINQTHGLPYNWELNKDHPADKGGIGDRSDDILNIIKKHKNVFYISGHIHAGLSAESDNNFYTSVEKYDGYTLINIPCFMYFDFIRGGHISNGTGFVFEVYDNEVMLRARNFITGTYLTKYDVTVDLT